MTYYAGFCRAVAIFLQAMSETLQKIMRMYRGHHETIHAYGPV